MSLAQKNGPAIAYVSEPFPSTGGKNIVIIEQWQGNQQRWYFGFFEGKPMHEREAVEEQEAYLQEVDKVLSEEHLISPDELEALLRSILVKR
jgi:hypothetical protein